MDHDTDANGNGTKNAGTTSDAKNAGTTSDGTDGAVEEWACAASVSGSSPPGGSTSPPGGSTSPPGGGSSTPGPDLSSTALLQDEGPGHGLVQENKIVRRRSCRKKNNSSNFFANSEDEEEELLEKNKVLLVEQVDYNNGKEEHEEGGLPSTPKKRPELGLKTEVESSGRKQYIHLRECLEEFERAAQNTYKHVDEDSKNIDMLHLLDTTLRLLRQEAAESRHRILCSTASSSLNKKRSPPALHQDYELWNGSLFLQCNCSNSHLNL